MLEILRSSLPFSKIREKVGKVDARAEVVVVNGKCFLEVLHGFLVVLLTLMGDAKEVETVSFRRALFRVLDLELD